MCNNYVTVTLLQTNVLCAVKIFHGFVDVDSFYSEAKFWDLLSSAKVPVPKFYGIVWSENEPRKALVSAFVGTRHNTQFSTNTMASMFQNNKTSTMQWLQLLIDISEILVKIHSLGLVHGDLKTDNILISETKNSGTVKRNRTEKTPLVVDFGQTTWSNDSYFYKLTTSVASKLQQDYTYIAPELLNSRLFTFASDVYALGDIMRITSKFLAAKRRTKLTNSLLGLSRQCMKKEPHNRPTSFETRRKLVGFL